MPSIRERKNVIPGRIELISATNAYSTDTPQPYWFPEYTESHEVMTPNSSKDRKAWKSFQHYKCWLSSPPTMQEATVSTDWNTRFADGHYWYHQSTSRDPFAFFCNEYGAAGTPTNGLPQWYVSGEDDGFVPRPSNIDDLKTTAYRRMIPHIKSELSLINTIIELKDLPSLPRTIANIAQFGSFLVRNLHRNLPRIGQTLRQALRTGSDGYLQVQFNILPLLSDISGISTALANYQKRINALIDQQGKRRVKHFSLPLQEYADPAAVSTTFQPPGSPPYWGSTRWSYAMSHAVRYVYTEPTIFHAQIEYNFNFTQFQLANARVLGLLDQLGVNLNPAIIWNALPWSFVVDWVISVQRWLTGFKQGNMDPVINIRRFLWSIKRQRRITVVRSLERPKYYAETPAVIIRPPEIPYPSLNEVAYRRTVEAPDANSLLASGLTPKEFSLAAALVLSRGRHYRRHRG